MENFPEVCGRMLREFDIQLNHNPSPISNTRLIQLMAINMFTVDNTELKGWSQYCLFILLSPSLPKIAVSCVTFSH
jgi:protein SMG6